MTESTLIVDNVSKLYRIGTAQTLESKNSNALTRLIQKPLNNFRKYRSLYQFSEEDLAGTSDGGDILWALRDVSFDIAPGELVGIVGANGAGKSTLLKIVSRITPPTRGRCVIRGRVSCLLEVGTGFHPELTGRENVYMNATILGMRKREVDAQFDAIVDFSGIGKFIDTPVKRYSSGMAVRLAFAIMAHLEPELLIVDEVLAVGDTEFQRKCLNTMGSVGKQGRAVLFVSHNMAAVTRLCNRGLLIRGGQLIKDASAAEVVHDHLTAGGSDVAMQEWPELNTAPGDDTVRLRAVKVVGEDGAPVGSIDSSARIGLQITFDVLEPDHVLSPYFTVVSDAGIDLFTTTDSSKSVEEVPRKPGRYVVTAWVAPGLLIEGAHYVRVVMRSVKRKYLPFSERDVVAFTVVDPESGGFAASWWEGKPGGIVRPQLEWTGEFIPPDMIIEG